MFWGARIKPLLEPQLHAIYPFPQLIARFGLRPTSEQPWSAHLYKAGREWCGDALAVYPSQARMGSASVHFQAAWHAGIEHWIEKFGSVAKLSGQLAFDLEKSAEGLWALECRPRLTRGIHLSLDQTEVTEIDLGQSPAKTLHAQPTPPLAPQAARVLRGKLRSAAGAQRTAHLQVGLLVAATHDIEWSGAA
ncbi:hypothetical protein ACFFLM_23640 [Deinococcus oregonensis]|uniref:Uncharacterized protein n=1 Tax=Deinococcus oregonensis TaxID=1805970 RepID=A0ABV6B5A6_9DEIO